MEHANFEIISVTENTVTIQDVGPHDIHKTVTNDVDNVVERCIKFVGTRKLMYYDSEDNLAQILVEDGKFAGFQAMPYGDLSEGSDIEKKVTNTIAADLITEQLKADKKEVHCIDVSGCQHCSFCHWDERGSEYNPYCSLHNRLHNPKMETEKQLTLEGFAGSDLTHELAMPSGCPLLEHTVVVRRNNYSKVIT